MVSCKHMMLVFHLFTMSLISARPQINENDLLSDNNNIDPQTSILIMRQGGKEVALGPTSMFFPNRIPFLIPLGTEEESAEYEEGEYTTDIEDEMPVTHYSNRQQYEGGLAPIYRDMNPKPKPVQAQMQMSSQGMDNSGRHVMGNREQKEMNNRGRQEMDNRGQQEMKNSGRQEMDNSGRQEMDNRLRQEMNNREKQEMDNRVKQGMDNTGRHGMDSFNEESDPSMSFKASKGQQSSMGQNQQMGTGKARKNMMNNHNKFVAELEPDFTIDANDSELPKSVHGLKNKNGNKNQQSGPKFGDRINKLKADFEPNFEVPFGPEENALKSVTNAPETPTTKYIPAPFSHTQFVDVQVPNQNFQNTQQKPASMSHKENKKGQLVEELEPDFSVPFGANDDHVFPNTQQRPVTTAAPGRPVASTLQPSVSTNHQGQIVADLEPDFTVPFGPSEDHIFPNTQQRPATTAAPGRPVSSTLPFSVSTIQQEQIVADPEPDFALPFGPNEKDTIQNTQQRPVTTTAPLRPGSSTLPPLVSTSHQKQLVADLEPDFALSFDPSKDHVFPSTQQRPTTTAKPGRPISSTLPSSSSTSNQGQLLADLEPDFSVPFGPNDKELTQTNQQRPVHPTLIQSNNQGILVPDLEPNFSVPFGPNDNEQYIAPQQKPDSTSTPKPAKKPFVTELEPDFSVPFGPNDHKFPQQKPAATPVPSFSTTTLPSFASGDNKDQIVPELETDFVFPNPANEVNTFHPDFQGQVTSSTGLTSNTQNQIIPDLEPDFAVPFGTGEQSQRPHQQPEPITPTRPVTEAVISTENIVPDQQPELGLDFNPNQDIAVTAVPATPQNPDQNPIQIEDHQNGLPSGQNLKPQVSENGQNIAEFENVDSVNEIVKTNETGLIDFSQAVRDEEGRLCMPRTEYIDSVIKEPVVECVHKSVEKCHYTYVTQFTPVTEEICDENFEKLCQITFSPKSVKEIVKKCYRPLQKICDGSGPETCQTVFETSCVTKYVPRQNGTKHVGETSCDKLPVKICGPGCTTKEGPEECHEKEVDVVMSVPEEICDLNPQKSCRHVTKMVPKLKPKHECTNVPKEVCNVRLGIPKTIRRPYQSMWCLDESAPERDSAYDEPNNNKL